MEKIYIGGMRTNHFHKAEGKVDLTLYLTGDDIAKITNYAKTGGAGTFKNKEGKTVVKVRIQTSKSGDKYYAEIDQYQPKDQASHDSQKVDKGEDILPF